MNVRLTVSHNFAANRLLPKLIALRAQVEGVAAVEGLLRIAIIIQHLLKNVNKLPVAVLLNYLVLDEVVGILKLVGHVPAGRAWFKRYKITGDRPKALRCLYAKLLKKNKHLFGVAAVAKVVIACIYYQPFWRIVLHNAVEKPNATRQGRATEAQVNRFYRRKIIIQATP